jgi:ribosomal protein L31
MRKRLPFIALLGLLILSACGYSMGESEHSVLKPEFRTIAISGVDNATTQTWLEPRIRKLLKDELNRRGTIRWVDDRKAADALIHINISRYNRPTALEGDKDQTLRSNASIRLQATIRSTTGDEVLWESGIISQSWPFYTGQESQADKEVTSLAIRQLADKMSENY